MYSPPSKSNLKAKNEASQMGIVLKSLETICSSSMLDITTISSSNGFLAKLG